MSFNLDEILKVSDVQQYEKRIEILRNIKKFFHYLNIVQLIEK